MNLKYLEKLEFNKILEILKDYAITEQGKILCLNLLPLSNKKNIEKALKETTEGTILLLRKGSIPISPIADIDLIIKKLISTNTLSAKSLLDLANILKIARNLRDYYNAEDIDMSTFSYTTNYFENLYQNNRIENAIFNSIIDENTIDDKASSTLHSIRKSIKGKEQEIKAKLNSFMHSKYVQENVITIRSGRYVVPVKQEYRSEVKGFIHDISSSGSTVFVEPLSVFELNNDLSNLKNDELIEIEKILARLSGLFLEIVDEIKNNANLIAIIDFIFAKAKYSISIDANEPIINEEKYIDLISAKHPLLNKDVAVANSINIGKTFNTLLITGPNTGGKTVMLKTVGLLVLMSMSGIHIPAKENSSIYVFDNVFADIGDEQSIQDSLSTFSSHMSNISQILEDATEDSLVLLDELGSGTDPVEGSCLAISILESLFNTGALTISTTHYAELKNYALTTDGFENASAEFDLETLSPTYKLLLGIPGTSNAFAISKKLGISENIITRAKELLNDDDIHIEDLLKNIYDNQRIIEKEKDEILKKSAEVESLREALKKDNSDLLEKRNSLIQNAKIEAREILLDAKEEANSLIKQIEKENNSKKLNEIRNTLNTKISDLKVTNSSDETPSINEKDLKLGIMVHVKSLNQDGILTTMPNKDKKVQVQIGSIKMHFHISDLALSNKSKEKQVISRPKNKEFAVKSLTSEINVIGQTVDEATQVIDKYLDTSALGGLTTIRIVHGKGTGALRKGIHAFLKNHPHVAGFRLGTFGEGEMGVTVVELK